MGVGRDQGETRPDYLQVLVLYPPGFRPIFSEEAINDIKLKASEQMKPDYKVMAFHEQLKDGLMFNFLIEEVRK